MSVTAEGLADGLVSSGVHRVFGVVGGAMSLELATAADAAGIPYLAVGHEASAGVMAGAFSRASSALGAAVTIKGPGFANLLPAVTFASLEGRPMLTFSEAYNQGAVPWMQHKRLAHRSMAEPVVRGFASVARFLDDPTGWAAMARAEIPGPVHVELADFEDTPRATLTPSSGLSPPVADLWRRIERARRPAVIVGDLATRRRWSNALTELRIPVFTTVAAKGVLDESVPHSAGPFTGRGGPLTAEPTVLGEADLVIGLGLRAREVLGVESMDHRWIVFDELDDPLGELPRLSHVADPSGESLGLVAQRLSHNGAWGIDLIEESRSRFQRAVVEGPWAPGPALSIIRRVVTHGVLVTDTGHFCTLAEHVWAASEPTGFLGASCSRWMGTGFMSSIGVALAHPGRPVVCALGDGGWSHALIEARLAVSQGLPLCVVLFSDGRFGSVASSTSVEHHLPAAVEVDLSAPERTMESFGYDAITVRTEAAMTAAMESWDQRRPLFVWARFDPMTYLVNATAVRR